MTAKRIEALFKPASVVLVGASETAGTLGDLVRRNLRDGGFPGTLDFVNLEHETIAGQAVYRSVGDLPGAPDLAVIVAPARAVPRIVSACGRKGIKAAIVVSAGFSEGGRTGAMLEREVKRRAALRGLRVLGSSSLGVIRTDSNLNASCAPSQPLPGRLGLVSQSGALCSAIIDWARVRNIGFSTVVSTGSETDVDVGEVLDYLARDPATDSIMLCLHEVDDARRLMSALRAAARVKPVVVLKAGRRDETADTGRFHSSSLVRADDVFDAAMRRAGVLRIRDFAELYTAAATLGTGARIAGQRLAIVSNTLGAAALAVDRARERGVPLAEFAAKSRRRLAALKLATPPGNPVYVRGDAAPQKFAEAARACVEDPSVDVLLAILVPHALTESGAIGESLLEIAASTRKAVFASWMGGENVTSTHARFAANSVPHYARPETAVDSIAALGLYATNQKLLLQAPAPLAPASTPDRARAQAVIDAALADGRDWLNPAESKAVLESFGVPVVRSLPARTADEATAAAETVGYPVAMKILSHDIAHKTDVGGVRLGLPDEATVRECFSAMLEGVAHARPGAELEGVLIEPMFAHRYGRELMVGVVRDPVFGPVISFGLGGILVEVIRDCAVALPPLNAYLARDLIRRTRAHEALEPLRGAPAADEPAVEEVLLRVSEIVCELPNVGAMDLNPVVVAESGAVVVDARIGLVPVRPDARPYEHMAIHPYPGALRDAMVLKDGTVVTIRPIRPEDAEIESAFVHGLSEQTKFLRFMFGLRDLTPSMLSRFTQIDYDRELALIAVVDKRSGEEQIAVGRYTTLPDEETCEFAIVVGDAWQGLGIARRLMQELVDAARQRRLKYMTGVTLRENARMIELSHALGFETRRDSQDPELVQMTLAL